MGESAVRRRVRITLLVLPIIMTLLIVGGVFAGFYVADLLGDSGSILLPLLFATFGLIASIAVSLLVIRIALHRS